MRSSGKTIIQHIYATHQQGVAGVGQLAELWGGLQGLNPVLQKAVAARFAQQEVDAAFFIKVLKGYWETVSRIPPSAASDGS